MPLDVTAAINTAEDEILLDVMCKYTSLPAEI